MQVKFCSCAAARRLPRVRFVITRDTLRGQARDVLLQQILSGKLKAGEVINLSQVAEDLGVSRTPLREALLALQEQGLVGMTERSQRFYVWPLTLKESSDLGQLAAVLEGLAVRTTPAPDGAWCRELRAINEKLKEVHGRPDEMIEWDDRFHALLIGGTNNKEVKKIVEQIRKRFHRYRWYGYDYVTLQGSNEKLSSIAQHASIVGAMERGDMEKAARLVEEHWQGAIALLERLLPKSDGFQAAQDASK